MASDVFISYSRKNADFARLLIDRLTLKGKDAWVDWEGIPLTSPNWWNEIRLGIESADSFLFIVSPDAMASVVCNMELDYAYTLQKRVIPVVYQDVSSEDTFASIADHQPDAAMNERLGGKAPLTIARENWHKLSHINWIFFRADDDFEEAFERLITTVETDLPYVKAHTRYLSRAGEWERENRRTDLLLIGEEIDRAEQWLLQGDEYAAQIRVEDTKVQVVNPLPQALHREYIAQSRQVDKRRHRLARSAQVSIAVLFLVAIVGLFTVFSTQEQSRNARAQVDVANTEIQAGETVVAQQATLVVDAQAAEATANSALTSVPPTLDAVATQVQVVQDLADSVALALRAQDVAIRGDYQLALALALEASTIADAVQTQRFLSELAYAPGARIRFYGHAGNVVDVALSPDGSQIVSGSWDNTVIVWDAFTGEQRHIFQLGNATVNSVAFSPDGTKIVADSIDNTLVLWDTITGEQLRSFQGHSAGVNSVAFSPDGRQIVSGSSDENIILWDVTSGEILRIYEADNLTINGVSSVAFSPDGTQILSGHSDYTMILWDLVTGQRVRVFAEHSAPVQDVAFSPDGSQILSGSSDERMILWDVATGDQLRSFRANLSAVNSVAFSPDGTQVVSGHNDGSIVLWDLATGDQLSTFRGHQSAVTSVVFSPDGTQIVSSSIDYTLILWDIAPGVQLHAIRGHDDPIEVVAFSPDGSQFASGSSDGDFILWDAATGTQLRNVAEHTLPVRSMDFSPDGSLVLSGSSDTKIILWDVATGEQVRSFRGHSDVVSRAVFSPDGTQIVSGSWDENVILWDVASGEQVRILQGHTGVVTSVAFSPDGTQIVSGSDDRLLILWDVASGEQVRTLQGHTGGVTSVAFSPDGAQIVSGSWDDNVILWDAASGEQIRTLQGHIEGVMTVAFSPDGTQIVSGSWDDNIILWDLATGEQLYTFSGHSRTVNSVVFSPDGSQILSGSSDGTLILWRRDSLDQLQSWTRANRYFPPITCEQRITYDVPARCDGDVLPEMVTLAPTRTLLPVLESTPLPAQLVARTEIAVTPSRTPLPIFTPIDTPTITPSVTVSPTPTPTATYLPVILAPGNVNRGEIQIGGSQRWTFEGRAGDVVTISVVADNPLNDADDATGLFDTYVILFGPTGAGFRQRNDIERGVLTDTIMPNIRLPADGTYTIEVRSWEDRSGGTYTLTIEKIEPETQASTAIPTP